jgi:hypothetical protein
MRLAKESGVSNSFTQYPKISTVVYILVSAAVAPVLLFPMFSEEMAIKFQMGLRSEIFKADQEI